MRNYETLIIKYKENLRNFNSQVQPGITKL